MIRLNSTDSTNSYLKKLAENGAPDRTAVIADMQTKGRGRMSRPFFSPSGSGLYMSILLRSPVPETNVTTAAAVAVCRVLESNFSVKTGIKWVNDVFIGGKKVCGILTEGVTTADGFYAVVGIGINVFEPSEGFPEELSGIAGYVSAQKPDTDKIHALAQEVYDAFFDVYSSGSWLEEYRKRCFVTGKKITWKSLGGTVVGIDDDYSLIVSTDEGLIKISSGEIGLHYD